MAIAAIGHTIAFSHMLVTLLYVFLFIMYHIRPFVGTGGSKLAKGLLISDSVMRRPLLMEQTPTQHSSYIRSIVNNQFSHDSAVRDFNQAMPMIVLPSGFQPQPRGVVIKSNPKACVGGKG